MPLQGASTDKKNKYFFSTELLRINSQRSLKGILSCLDGRDLGLRLQEFEYIDYWVVQGFLSLNRTLRESGEKKGERFQFALENFTMVARAKERFAWMGQRCLEARLCYRTSSSEEWCLLRLMLGSSGTTFCLEARRLRNCFFRLTSFFFFQSSRIIIITVYI